ncbi:hypothetical protein Cadr_000018262 [Camelus dromedarius]|uniref:Uncharacterized protein n=1 Tax=Camelus dromedarius TaxID=9838 RepID=A0A5N4D762_CAMDR|nr:hypothetical protein Cadr_000018262 [Camelus dromedarius]
MGVRGRASRQELQHHPEATGLTCLSPLPRSCPSVPASTKNPSPERGGKTGLFAGRASSVSMRPASPPSPGVDSCSACRFFARRPPLRVTSVKPSSAKELCDSISVSILRNLRPLHQLPAGTRAPRRTQPLPTSPRAPPFFLRRPTQGA